MKRFFLLCIVSNFVGFSLAQKPVINSSVYGKWPDLSFSAISNDGRYVIYRIENQPIGSQTLVIQATDATWKMEIPGAEPYSNGFTRDSRMAYFSRPNDSLCLVTVGGSPIENIPHVTSFKIAGNGTGEWLVYKLEDPKKELVLRNLSNGKQKSFTTVNDFFLNDDARTLVILSEGKDPGEIQALHWASFLSDSIKTIWSAGPDGSHKKVLGCIFDKSGTQIAFVVEDSLNNQSEHSFWYYKAGMGKAILLADNHSNRIDSTWRLDRITKFSRDGNRIFFVLKPKEYSKSKRDGVQVDVWSYTDPKLQSQQLSELDPNRDYTCVIDIKDHHIIQLENENEYNVFLSSEDSNADEWELVKSSKGSPTEWNWNPAARQPVYLISTMNGVKRRMEPWGNFPVNISPGGKYLIYYDAAKKNFFSQSTSTGKLRNITKNILVTWLRYGRDDAPETLFYPKGVAAWEKGDSTLLLYDRNDIWEVDPEGIRPAINITNGFGHRNHIIFTLTPFTLTSGSDGQRAIGKGTKLLITAFDTVSKDNGFYSKVLGQEGDPELLTMGPYIYYNPDNPYVSSGFPLAKAASAEKYIVGRMSAEEAPNYFSTTNFKSFTRLTDLHPEKKYNWLKTELVSWKTFDGTIAQGVLYKPENFDPAKKYPVIFYYYDIKSDALHEYFPPQASAGTINIVSYVSNGYLVFSPDIHFKIGHTGESVINSVVSAAKYLSQRPYVDAKRMGIQGHSLGGFETNYLVTHSNLFAAACSVAGISDFISGYGGLDNEGSSLQHLYELDWFRVGAAIWQRPDLYIQNSPVLHADKVTTPLLMMHSKDDGICPFSNAIEFFTALRRLHKKVWLLQYDGEDHGLNQPQNQLDFSIRLAQFFGHYLKGEPAPKWMVNGIPASLKGIESGLEISR